MVELQPVEAVEVSRGQQEAELDRGVEPAVGEGEVGHEQGDGAPAALHPVAASLGRP